MEIIDMITKKKLKKDDERFIYFGMLFHRKYKM